jgi:hypothetical protein
MKLPIQAKPVLRLVDSSKVKRDEIVPSACNPDENCTVDGPNYPCPTWSNPGRMCQSSFDDPICLTRRSACKSQLIGCVAGAIGTAAFAPQCVGCIVTNASVGGVALAGCAIPCGTTAAALQLAVQNC